MLHAEPAQTQRAWRARRDGRPAKGDSRPAGAPRAPADAHEWVSFEDPAEERTWVFDATFLLSSWTCIYGRGCPGIGPAPAPEKAQGCCSHGAHFTDEADVRRVEAAARRLSAEQWQFKARASGKPTKRNRAGETVTRMTEGACIFLNRPGFPGGPGCALHRAALEQGRQPLELKPEVCWQVPLRREDHVEPDGHVTSTVGEWGRRHWGPGGSEFHWWCTEEPDAFVGAEPVVRAMKAELTSMVGKEVYATLARYLASRASAAVPLPHPVVRRR